MGIGEDAGTKAIELLNTVTLPRLTATLDSLLARTDKALDEDWAAIIRDLHGLLDRVQVDITIHVLPRKS